MKKSMIIVVVVLMLFSATTQLRADSKNLSIFANFGIMVGDDFSFDPLFWYGGINLDFHIGDLIMISPELNLVTYKFSFDVFILEPAVILNFKLGDVFIGGGLEKMFLITGGSHWSGDWALKLNTGYRGSNIKLTLFTTMAFDNLFKYMLIGVTFGLGF